MSLEETLDSGSRRTAVFTPEAGLLGKSVLSAAFFS